MKRTLFWLALLAAMAGEIAAVKAFGQGMQLVPAKEILIQQTSWGREYRYECPEGYKLDMNILIGIIPACRQIPKPPPHVKKKKLEGYWGSGDWNMGLPPSERKP